VSKEGIIILSSVGICNSDKSTHKLVLIGRMTKTLPWSIIMDELSWRRRRRRRVVARRWFYIDYTTLNLFLSQTFSLHTTSCLGHWKGRDDDVQKSFLRYFNVYRYYWTVYKERKAQPSIRTKAPCGWVNGIIVLSSIQVSMLRPIWKWKREILNSKWWKAS